VEQIRQAAVKLPRASDDSCSLQHTLKPVGNKPRRPSQHGVTIPVLRCGWFASVRAASAETGEVVIEGGTADWQLAKPTYRSTHLSARYWAGGITTAVWWWLVMSWRSRLLVSRRSQQHWPQTLRLHVHTHTHIYCRFSLISATWQAESACLYTQCGSRDDLRRPPRESSKRTYVY